jgi:hypothetical protein
MANYLTTGSALAFHWPSLSELNDDIALFHGCQRRNAAFTSPVTQLQPSRSCIRAPLWHHQFILFLLFPNSTPLFAQSFKVLTASSLFHTALVQMKPANGICYKLRSSNQCLHTHRACRMDTSFWNSSFATLAICASTRSTNTTSSNTTPSASFCLHSHQWTRTLSVRPIHWLTTLSARSYVPFGID